MKKLTIILAAVVCLTLSSCAVSGPITNPQALVTKNPVGTKVGTASKNIWLGIWIGNTDLSITKAAQDANITKVATVDTEIKAGFLKTKYTTIVTGE